MAGGPLTQWVRDLHQRGDTDRLPDVELLRRFVSDGSEDAFSAIVRRHGPLVLSLCQQLLPDAHDAEDAFQATFVVLVRKASSIARGELLANWLYGVAQRVAMRARLTASRRRSRETPVAELADPRTPLEPGVREIWTALHDEIARLPTKYRLPVVLCYLEGKTHDEAAVALDWPKGTVAGRLARARDLLHRRLVRRGLAVPAGGIVVLLWAGSSPAAVPASLVSACVAAALAFAAGGPISASVLHLTEGVLKAMFLTKVKNVMLVGVLGLVLIAVSAGVLAANALDRDPLPEAPVAQAPAPVQPPPAQAEPQPLPRRPVTPRIPKVAPAPAQDAVPQPPTQDVAEQPKKKKPEEPPQDKGPKERQTIETNVNGINILGFTPNGKSIILSGGGDLEFWDIDTGKKHMSIRWDAFDRHRGHVVVSPDGKLMGGASPMQGVVVWELATGKALHTLTWPKPMEDPDTGAPIGPPMTVYTTISADTRRAATWTVDNKITIYDIASGKKLASIAVGPGIRYLALSPDGKRLTAMTNAPKVWDAETGKELFTLASRTDRPEYYEYLKFSADGKRIIGSTHHHIVIWNAQDGKLEKAIETGVIALRTSVALSPDAKTLAVAPRDKHVHLVDVATGKELTRFHWVSWPGDVAFSPDGRFVASSRNGRVRIWDVNVTNK